MLKKAGSIDIQDSISSYLMVLKHKSAIWHPVQTSGTRIVQRFIG
jgi:hypothetical protein